MVFWGGVRAWCTYSITVVAHFFSRKVGELVFGFFPDGKTANPL